MPSGRKNAPAKTLEPSLRDEVRQHLLTILRDGEAPAAARASAARSLLEYCDDRPADEARSLDDVTEGELDRLIASHKIGPSST